MRGCVGEVALVGVQERVADCVCPSRPDVFLSVGLVERALGLDAV
jgi:hypothetical protein